MATIINKMKTEPKDRLPISQLVIEFPTKADADEAYDLLNKSTVLSKDKFQARIIEKLY
jgi:hypothetical protein